MVPRYLSGLLALLVSQVLGVAAIGQTTLADKSADVKSVELELVLPSERAVNEYQKLSCENCTSGTCENCVQATRSLVALATEPDPPPKKLLKNTHSQTSIFTPKLDGKSVTLTMFRIRPNGQVITCVAPLNSKQPADIDSSGFVQVYSPDLELLNQIGLPFRPDAIDIDSSGNMYVGGEGQIAKLSESGEPLLSSPSPNLEGRSIEQMKEDLVLQTEQQQKRSKEVYAKQMAVIQQQIDKIEAIEEDERSKSEISRLKSYNTRLRTYQRLCEGKLKVDESLIERRIKSQFKVTSIAVTAKDLFVATNASSGTGYVVYRMDLDLKNSECILEKLRGCCGQMDVYASEDKVYVAENTKFRVGVYDRDGTEIDSMGERLKKDNQGFGGCCNPMNVLCCPDGSVLTSESTLGKLKRFNAEGELIGIIGSADIGTGCKNVAFGFDESRDRYYVQHKDKNSICILNRDKSVPDDASETEPDLESVEPVAEVDRVVGIGLQLKQNDDGTIVVVGMIPNSPAAEKSTIQPDDVLIAVGDLNRDMVKVEGMELAEVVDMIRGPVDTTVRLKVRSADGKRTRSSNLVRAAMSMVGDQWKVSR